MPELPEVETVRRVLETQIINEQITSVEVRYDRIVQNNSVDEFINSLLNQTVRKMMRYGKYLLFVFDDVTLISHLRMEGKYFLKHVSDPIGTHEHIIFNCKSGLSIRYHDTRKFGTMKVVNTTVYEEVLKQTELARLGKEANDESYTPIELYNKIHKKQQTIKQSLLDQDIICGLGNIYVNEVLFCSKISPLERSNKITLYECEKILIYSRYILKQAIDDGGTTIRSYTSSLGVTGRFQQHLYVHSLEGQNCKICNTPIIKTFVGGRGTYICPKCQHLHPLVIGITGGIATGKSTVTNYLISKGYEVVDADYITKKLYDSNQDLMESIKELFGVSVIKDDKIDKKAVGKIAFNNEELLKKLEQIIHPLVKKEILKAIYNSNNPFIFIDVPLLFEAKFDSLCHQTIIVTCDKDTEIKRLVSRDSISEEFARKRIDLQMDLDKKASMATYKVDNSKDLCYTYKQVDDIINLISKGV